MTTFTGTKGDDVLTGTTVSDTFFASQGNDTISGGAGTDRLTINLWNTSLFDAATGSRTFTISADQFTDGSGAINTSFSSIERFTFDARNAGDFGDTIDASGFVSSASSPTSIYSGDGDDTITGSGMADFIQAGRGSNWVDGGGGADTVVLYDGSTPEGTLLLTGSGGTISTTADSGEINAVFNAEFVRIYANSSTSGMHVDASGLTGFAGQILYACLNGTNVIVGHSGADFFSNTSTYYDSVDTFTGNGGADIYDYTVAVGAMDGDTITDLDGDDTIDFQYNNAQFNGGGFIADHFIGSAAFSGTVGEYRSEIVGDHTIVQADTNGDGIADQTLTIANGAFALGETAAGSNILHITGYSPVNSVPGAQQTDENASLTFASGTGNALSVSDADIGSGNLTVTLSVAHGTLTLGGYTGLSFSSGDGTGDSTMTFAGTAEAINAALEGLTYAPDFGFEGDDSLTVTTNDNGSSGLQDVDAVTITVNSIDNYGTDDADFMVGTKGNDSIHALGGDDIIAATSGFDFNDGGDGYDQLRFVTGNTTRFDQPWDSRTITITNDWVGASDGTINSYYSNIESLYFSTANTGNHGDTIDASALTSTPLILRLAAGNDTVTGGGGNDDIALGLGVNSADAGAGNDVVRATFNNSAGATAYVTNAGGTVYVTADGVQTATISNAETVVVAGYYASGATTMIDASGFAPMPEVMLVLADSNGSDVIIGSHGNDMLANTSGNTLGSDTFTGNGGADIFDWTYASDDLHGDVITDLDFDDTLDFRFNNGDVQGASPLLMNHFIGNAAFSGTAGEYRYEVVDYQTLLEADNDGDGVADQVLTIANGGFVLSETAPGSNILQITGISGSAGDDFLLGGLDDDSIYAQGGNDVIAATQGADYVDGGDGFDQLRFQTGFPDRFAPATGPRTYTITADHVGDSTGTVDTSFTNVESIFLRTIGNGDYGDTIDASALTGAGLILRLGAGNDTVIGSAGNDDIGLNLGINTADAGDGYDIVYTAFDNQSGATAYVTSSGGTVLVTVGGVQVASIVNGEQVHITGGYSSGATTTIDASAFDAIPDVTLVLRDSNGSDVIIGSHGADILSNVGLNSLGSDTFTGNGGADVFDWTYASDNMHGDVITDLDDDDTLDFRFNDGNVEGASPLVMNHFIGGGAFSGTAGEYRFEIVGNTTQIQADTDGDGVADQVMTISNGAFMLDETSPGSNVLHITTHVITGTNNSETLSGTIHNDNISALGGGDTILASQGYDNVDGGSSGFNGDRLTINLANTSLFDAVAGARDYTVGANSFTDNLGYIHTNFTDIERFTFNDTGTGDHDDSLDASGLTSTYAGAGIVLNVTMGNGNNSVTGSNYYDFITTGSGDDVVNAGAGDDVVSVGLGINTVEGGAGIDTVSFTFDNTTGATLYINESGGVITTAVDGVVTNTITGVEYLSNRNLDTSAAVTRIDASGVAAGALTQLGFYDNNGSDILIGSHGSDFFSNGSSNTAGGDTYTGNGGADIYDYTYAVNGMDGDTITDLDSDDVIDLRFNNASQNGGAAYRADHFIGTAAFSGVAGEYRFQVSGNTTLVQVDTNGDGIADETLTITNGAFNLAETAPGSNLLHVVGQVVTGTGAVDTLTTTLGSDLVYAQGSSDIIYGSQGADIVDGGPGGADRLFMNTGDASLFTLASGARTYTIGANSITDSSGTLNTSFTNVERIAFSNVGNGDFDDVIDASGFVSTHGAALDIRLGNGDNQVTGSGVNDRIFTGYGSNVVDAGAGYDYGFINVDASSAVTVTIQNIGGVLVTDANGAINHFTNFENVWVQGFGSGTVTLDASAYTDIAGLALVLIGHDGTDIIIGSAGNDFISSVTGEVLGSDILTGNGGADTFDYTYAVDSMNGDTITDLDADDVIDLRFNTLIAGQSPLLANHFIGNAAFSGTAGEYRFQISGNQTLIQLDSNGDGVADQVLTIANGAFNIAETAPGSNILHMVGQVVTGTSGNDTLYSSSGDDIVNSLGGSDFIYGSQGHDTIDGGGNIDRLVFLTFDSTRFAAATGDRTYTVTASHVSDSSGTIDTSFTSVERINILTNTNGNFNDTFDLSGFVTNPNIGTVGYITTGNGNNTIIGSNYSDSFNIGTGHNVVDGGAGADYMTISFANSSGDTLYVNGTNSAFTTTLGGVVTNQITSIENLQFHYADPYAPVTRVDASGMTSTTVIGFDDSYGSDILIGSHGSDFFANGTGKTAADTYTGNGGADTFDYTYAADSMNGDTITDLDADDVIDLRFNSLNPGGSPLRADHFIGAAAFSGTAGEYRYQISGNQTLIQLDSNGDGIADQTLTIANGAFAIVETAPGSNMLKLGAAFPGTAADDTLFGTAGNDTINALAGNDFLKGGTGDDVLNGGAGSDRAGFYTTDPALGGVSVSLLLQGTAQNTHQGWDTLIGIENLSGTPFADVLIGDGGNNFLWGSAATIAPGNISTANNDWLDGGAGNDVLIAGIGNHTLIGGTGNDTLVFTENGAPETGVTISLLQTTAQVTGNGSWTISGIENVVGGTANDALTGDGFANILAGQAGTDMLVGGQGNDTLLGDGTIDFDGTVRESGFGSGDDTLDGGLGADRMVGGQGNDFYYVDNLGDVVIEAAGEGYDTIQAGISGYTMGDNADRLNATVTGTFTGNGSDNLMVAGAANTTFNGGAGNDTLQMLSGNNTANGGAGNDTLIVSFASATAAIKMLAPSATGDGSIATSNKSETTNFTGIENFTITTGSGNDSIVTGSGNDSISTGAGTDTIKSGAGNDIIDGGAGVDTMSGGANDDTYVVDNAGDVVTELAGEGTDLVRILTTAATLSYRLAANVENMIVASATAATLYDNALNNVITGGALADTISAEAGGNDVLAGGGGADSFVFGTALTSADSVDGGIGSDTLSLKGSYDLTFGATTMTNVETLLLQSSTLVGHHYTLAMNDANVAAGTTLTVNGSALANDEVLRFSGSAETDGRFDITGGAAGDFLTGGAGADVIRGGAGADQINGGAGNDTLTGGTGTDTFIFGPNSGVDHITDFAKAEVIALNGIAGVDDYSDLHIVMDGPNAMISWGTSDSIILDGVKASSLSAANFTFSATAPLAALASFDPSGGGVQHLASFDTALHADVVPVL